MSSRIRTVTNLLGTPQAQIGVNPMTSSTTNHLVIDDTIDSALLVASIKAGVPTTQTNESTLQFYFTLDGINNFLGATFSVPPFSHQVLTYTYAPPREARSAFAVLTTLADTGFEWWAQGATLQIV